ncbi:MAG: hypothetical protein E6J82_18030 [Deltaproteobacteria bacterium]|nr:MAG: hypothetical protein E6J82_18030 [Deltaproteobacteria bacterium]
MKSRTLHALAVACAASFVACRTGGGKSASGGIAGMDPTTKVAEVDGQPVTYGDLQNDHEVGAKLRQAEVKALTDLYDQRRGLLDEMISRRLLEEEAKAKGKTVEQWYQTEYVTSVPEPSDAEAKAFYEEHKAQVPQGQTFDDLKDRIKQAVRQQKLRGSAADRRGGEGPVARSDQRARDHRGVQRLPVPLLRARVPGDREADEGVRRQVAAGVPPLSPRLPSLRAEGGGGGRVRAGPGEVLGAARQDVHQPGQARGCGSQGIRQVPGDGRAEVRQVPRQRGKEGAGRRRPEGGIGRGREWNAGVLHQRHLRQRRAALRAHEAGRRSGAEEGIDAA